MSAPNNLKDLLAARSGLNLFVDPQTAPILPVSAWGATMPGFVDGLEGTLGIAFSNVENEPITFVDPDFLSSAFNLARSWLGTSFNVTGLSGQAMESPAIEAVLEAIASFASGYPGCSFSVDLSGGTNAAPVLDVTGNAACVQYYLPADVEGSLAGTGFLAAQVVYYFAVWDDTAQDYLSGLYVPNPGDVAIHIQPNASATDVCVAAAAVMGSVGVFLEPSDGLGVLYALWSGASGALYGHADRVCSVGSINQFMDGAGDGFTPAPCGITYQMQDLGTPSYNTSLNVISVYCPYASITTNH